MIALDAIIKTPENSWLYRSNLLQLKKVFLFSDSETKDVAEKSELTATGNWSS